MLRSMSTGSLSSPQSNKVDVTGLAGSALCRDSMPVILGGELDLCSSFVQHWSTDNGFHSMSANTEMEVMHDNSSHTPCNYTMELRNYIQTSSDLTEWGELANKQPYCSEETQGERRFYQNTYSKPCTHVPPWSFTRGAQMFHCYTLKGSKKSNNKVFYTQVKSRLLIFSQYVNLSCL